MRKNNLLSVLKKIYRLLDKKQKIRFIIIIIIMIVSATLAQLTPKAIGWLTDDILSKDSISFEKVIPFLIFILIVNVVKDENNTTIIAIAHRLTTLKNCDRIIVLNKGHIEEEGKFDELIDKGGMFSDMYYGKLS